MTFTLAELQLLVRALALGEGRLETYARSSLRGKTRGSHSRYLAEAERMQTLRHKLSTFRARHDVVEVQR